MLIWAITEQVFELEPGAMLLILEALEAVGLQHLPAWHLDRGSLTIASSLPAPSRVLASVGCGGAQPSADALFTSISP